MNLMEAAPLITGAILDTVNCLSLTNEHQDLVLGQVFEKIPDLDEANFVNSVRFMLGPKFQEKAAMV